LAYNVAEIDGMEAGLAELAKARVISEAMGDGELLLLVNGQHGVMAYRTGDLREAVGHLDVAVGLIDHGSAYDRVSVLLNRGALNLYLGRVDAARSDINRAVEVAEDAGLALELYKAKHNLGYAEFLTGNLPRALELLADAARSAPERFGASELDRARVLVESGLVHEAAETLIDAEGLLRRQRQWQDVGEVELARAECALLLGEPRVARRLAGRARDRFRRRGSSGWLARAQLLLLQADLADGRPGQRLAGPALAVAAQLASAGRTPEAATAYRVAAQALLRSGHAEQAEQAAKQAAPVRASDPITARLHANLVRAELSLARGQSARARTELRSGLRELASYQARFGSIDLQTASAVHGRRLAQLDLAIGLRTGRPGEVLAAIERGRATSTRVVTLRPPADVEEANLLSQLRVAVDSARESRLSQDEAEESTQRQLVADLQQRLRDRAWTAAGTGAAANVTSVADILATVRRHGVVLVAYFVSDGQLGAVVIGGAAPALQSLGPFRDVIALIRRTHADLDVLALDQVPDPVRRVVHGSFNRDLRKLDDSLLQPLGVARQSVVVVTAGTLDTVPWNALPSRRAVPTVATSSASGWVRRSGPDHAVRPVVTALAGPGLSRASHEARTVVGCWPGARLQEGANADRTAAMSAMGDADVVHVAAHGTHQADSPLFSSLRLADGPVFAHELDPDTVRASHVVLSACEVGRSTLRPGDEALGLTSVLLRLGVRSVVASVARVNDTAAAGTMAAYHRELARGIGSAEALASALAGQDDDTPVPFVCFGASWQAASPA
jgi:tetratricopeptide (TPR) repeat protein